MPVIHRLLQTAHEAELDLRHLAAFDAFEELVAAGLVEVFCGQSGVLIVRGGHLTDWLDYPTDALAQGSIEELAPTIPKGTDVVLSIDLARCFVRRLDGLKVTARKLEGILRLDLARLTPFREGEVISGFAVLPPEEAADADQVIQVVVKKSVVRPAIDVLSRNGIRCRALTFRKGSAPACPIALNPDGSPYASCELKRWFIAAVVAAILPLAVFAAANLHLNHVVSRRHTELQHRVALVEQQARAVQERLGKVLMATREGEEIVAWRMSAASQMALVEELSRLLPDDTYLVSLVADGLKVTLEGRSGAPENLVLLMEESKHFKQVRFAAPVYRNANDQYAHFMIDAGIERQQSQGP